MSESQIRELSHKLDMIIRLLALSITDNKAQREKIRLMGRAGFPPKQIAEILGTTANTVRVELSMYRKQHRR